MNEQRLSLSSSVFTGRVRKFDSYQHNPATSQRVVNNSQLRHNSTKAKSDVGISRPSTKSLVNSTNLAKVPIKKSAHSFSASEHSKQSKISILNSNNLTIKLALNAITKSTVQQGSTIENQFVEDSVLMSKFKSKHSRMHMAFYGLGVLVFLFAGFASVQTIITNRNAKQQLGFLGDMNWNTDSEGVAEGTGTDPAETEVTAQAIANYKVDPELPRYISIPELGVRARIKHTGVDKSGAVDAPKNVNDVSWYNESAKPGNAIGSSLLLGHVSGWTSAGVSKKIDQLKPGQRFEIEKGSGEKLTYEVTKGERIPLAQVDMSKILGTEVAGEHDMKLMTCSGKYNKDTKQFEERYVVYAKILR